MKIKHISKFHHLATEYTGPSCPEQVVSTSAFRQSFTVASDEPLTNRDDGVAVAATLSISPECPSKVLVHSLRLVGK